MPISNFHRIVLLIAVVVYIITAVKSKGYYHYDEHYQIIEFAGLKLGSNQPHELAWEYRAHIRPAFQPAIAILLFKTFESMGINDAYTLALALRVITMLLALTAITLFVHSSLPLVETNYHRAFILLSYFLWFLPYLNVRYSSESWSGSMFLLATAIVTIPNRLGNRHLLFAGFFLGISFICRFQSAILIISLYAWLIIVGKFALPHLALVTCAAAVAVLLGVTIDSWYYGEMVFTPWNYYQINIIEDVASQFGTAPWYFYIRRLWNIPGVALLLVCTVILFFKERRHLLLWIILPFFIIHSFIAHKEIRFLFPLINFAPLLLVLSWQEIVKYLRLYNPILWRPPINLLAGILVMINVAGLATTSLTAAGNGWKAITFYIHKNLSGKSLNLIYQPFASPYNPLDWLALPETFYKDENIREMNLEDVMATGNTDVLASKNNLWVIRKKLSKEPGFQELADKYGLELIMQSIPSWAEWVTQYYNEADNENILMLYGQPNLKE